MKHREPKGLTAEDRILWSRVARTATPLPGKNHPEEAAEFLPGEAPPAQPARPQNPSRTAPAPAPAAVRRPGRLDAPTKEKLARGRIDIAGRVDLHGLTQTEAHGLLLSFLRQAHAGERRYVLVITGKGSGQGVLRRVVPQWFSTPPFSEIVGGFEEAARHHGGGGALYVRLRRRERAG